MAFKKANSNAPGHFIETSNQDTSYALSRMYVLIFQIGALFEWLFPQKETMDLRRRLFWMTEAR